VGCSESCWPELLPNHHHTLSSSYNILLHLKRIGEYILSALHYSVSTHLIFSFSNPAHFRTPRQHKRSPPNRPRNPSLPSPGHHWRPPTLHNGLPNPSNRRPAHTRPCA
jgi:hypothetical protein